MKLHISYIFVSAMLILSLVAASCSGNNKTIAVDQTVISTNDEAKEAEEMRGLWVSHITLDMSGTDRSFTAFKEKFNAITEEAIKYKCNTLIVQVRPFSDAIYRSEIYPSSHILSGTQGVDTDYDALEYMCEYAHKNGLKIHAWINPYRVATASTPSKLAENNPYVKDNLLGVELDSGIYLNPAKKAVRELIVSGVLEIIENYPVDGIQFDDYFYPTDFGDSDAEQYSTYKKSLSTSAKAMSLEEWRTENVNVLIAEVYKSIKEYDENIVFGLSPQGNIDNNKTLCADVESWCEIVGYVDYICPQMYYSTENPSLGFEESLKAWADFSYHSGIDVYIGLGAYKAGTDADNGTWLGKNNVLATELILLREYGYDGYMIYDYSAFVSEAAKEELNSLLEAID